MKAAGVPPDVVTFSTLIKACNNAGDLGKAFEVLAEMAGVAPNAVTVRTLIKACDNAGDFGKAFEVLAEMKAAGIRPNVVTFSALMRRSEWT